MSSDDVAFSEILPVGCPPNDAIKSDGRTAFRLIKMNPPIPEDFFSHSKLAKRKPPDVPLCNWMSCSLNADKVPLINFRKMPRFKDFKFIAVLRLEKESGMIKEKNGHIDFWMYASFNPIDACEIESADP
ncbi:MAG: hypothetical protein HQL93_09805 [Magnetococcales bacterium]|nr:hypothetical protein [Magnetococcales bacterium]